MISPAALDAQFDSEDEDVLTQDLGIVAFDEAPACAALCVDSASNGE